MSRRIAPFLVALAAVFGCKSVTQEPPPQELVIATFDSAVGLVPTPSDLALASSKDMPPSNQKMMLQWFVQGGGFPGEQGVAVSVPLNRWVWNDAAGNYVKDQSPATQPRIDPASVITAGASANVIVLKVDGGPGAAPVQIDVELDAENSVSAVSFTPPPAGSVIPGTVLSSRLQFHKMADANGSRRWAPGRYVFVVRGGASGVKACSGACTAASARIALSPDKPLVMVAPNLDLTNPKNQPIMKVTPEQIAQLEQVRASLWNPLTWGVAGPLPSGDFAWAPSVSANITPAFVAAGRYMAPSEVAAIGTFSIAGPKPVVSVDSDSGLVPLPFDLARTGPGVFDAMTLTTVKTIGYNSAFGPAALGLTSLNGFSTTAMIFAPTSIPIDADTVTPSTVYLLKKQAGAWAVQTLLTSVAIEPGPVTTTAGNYVAAGVPCTKAGGRCSSIVALQPAVTGAITIPPLDEATDYAVVITTGVKTMPIFVPQYATTLQLPLGRSAMARLLLETPNDQNHMFAASLGGPTISSLSGVTPETATALQTMRQQLRFDASNVVSTFVETTGLPTDSIAMAYTFRTQSVTGTSLSLSLLPFANGAGIDASGFTTLTPTAAAADYGIPATVLEQPSLQEIAEVKITTTNLLLGSLNSGAFDPAHPTTEVITALVAIPNPALVTTTCTPLAPAGTDVYAAAGITHCAPLVVFEHGLTSSKAAMLPLAANLAAKGFVVASIDQMMQGHRSYCSGSGANAQTAANAMCGAGTTCVFKANLTTPVDGVLVDGAPVPVQIGLCEDAQGVRGLMAGTSPKGTPAASANRLLSMNFFRLRDAARQDVIDEAALMKALAPIGPGQDAFANYLRTAHGITIDWNKIFLVGHSGGAINGAMTMAVNPRVKRAVTYAPGATFTDIAANPASAFHATLVSLLPASSAEGTSGYMKLLQIAKWILDPSDPANYLRYVVPGHVGSYPPSPFTLDPRLATLAGLYPTQPTRDLLVQLSLCDGTVPNPQNLNYVGQAGLAATAAGDAGNSRVQWYSKTSSFSCPDDQVSHSNLLDFAYPASGPTRGALTAIAQGYVADFLQAPSDVPTTIVAP